MMILNFNGTAQLEITNSEGVSLTKHQELKLLKLLQEGKAFFDIKNQMIDSDLFEEVYICKMVIFPNTSYEFEKK